MTVFPRSTDSQCAAARPYAVSLYAVMAAKTISYTVGLCLLLIWGSPDLWEFSVWITVTEVAAAGARFVITRRIECIAGLPARRFWPDWLILAALLAMLLLLSC